MNTIIGMLEIGFD